MYLTYKWHIHDKTVRSKIKFKKFDFVIKTGTVKRGGQPLLKNSEGREISLSAPDVR